MDYKNEIIKQIQKMAGRYSVYEIFADWIKLTAIAISNSVDVLHYEQRETQYMETIGKYSSEEGKLFGKLCGLLTMAMDQEMSDILGYIYMHLEISGKHLGQFFTPYHVCQLMAKMSFFNIKERDGPYTTLNEPAVGAGANIIAFCEEMKRQGINYQSKVLVIAQDLDWKCVYMSYVQFALYGIPAIVVQGNTLTAPYTGGYGKNVFVTPIAVLYNMLP